MRVGVCACRKGPVAVSPTVPDYEQRLIAAFQQSVENEGATVDEDSDDGEQEDTPETEELKRQLDKSYDEAWEDAFKRGFRCASNTKAGKRYMLFKAGNLAEQEKYQAADAQGKKDMISRWVEGKYNMYQDRRFNHTQSLPKHSQNVSVRTETTPKHFTHRSPKEKQHHHVFRGAGGGVL